MKEKEIIICSAVIAENGKIYRGHRHNNCLALIHELKLKPEQGHDSQGFITSKNRFVTRKEGLKLQLEAGITSNEPNGYVNELFSEDLY